MKHVRCMGWWLRCKFGCISYDWKYVSYSTTISNNIFSVSVSFASRQELEEKKEYFAFFYVLYRNEPLKRSEYFVLVGKNQGFKNIFLEHNIVNKSLSFMRNWLKSTKIYRRRDVKHCRKNFNFIVKKIHWLIFLVD